MKGFQSGQSHLLKLYLAWQVTSATCVHVVLSCLAEGELSRLDMT